ncbi:hypothetical protein GCM10009701_40950 [Mycolicibacterium murale]
MAEALVSPRWPNATPSTPRRRSRHWICYHGALLALAAAALLLGGCSPPPSRAEALASVEINDEPLALPDTQLVICRRTANEQSLFFWTGAIVTAPRRPLDRRRFDSVEVQFDDQPLTPTAVTFQFSHHGEHIGGQWPGTAGGDATVMLTSPVPGHYLLTATMPQLDPQLAGLVFLRIEFVC